MRSAGATSTSSGFSLDSSRPSKYPNCLELAARVMPLDPRPIVDTLQRQMYIFVSLQFDDRQTSRACYRQNVDHRAIRG